MVLTLNKPGGVGPQRFVVTDATGAEIGRINQRIRVVREAFELVIIGQPPGVLASENWYDYRFSVLDASGAAYAQVQKVYEGYARARFTSARPLHRAVRPGRQPGATGDRPGIRDRDGHRPLPALSRERDRNLQMF